MAKVTSFRLIVITAGIVVLGGCVSPRFEPRSRATRDLVEPGTPRPAQPAEEGGRWTISDAPETHPSTEALADAMDRPFVIADRAPGVNVFGEFDGAQQQPKATAGGRAGYQQHTWLDEGFDADVAVDPTGEWLVFASTRHSRRSNLYLQRTDGMAVTKLTSDPADDAFPVFSPRGDRVAFCSNRNGNWDIYLMDPDGKNVRAVTSGPAQELHPTFSPDGRYLAYCSSGRSGQWELWVADLSGGERTMIGYGLFPSWSPRADKDIIAFQRARERGGRWFSIWTLEIVDGEPVNITEVAMSPNAALVAPAWAPDGMRLAFATVVEPDAPGLPAQQDIWTIHADGTNRARLTDARAQHATPFWAADGRVYFISNRGGKDAIWSTRADGPNQSTAAIDAGPAGR